MTRIHFFVLTGLSTVVVLLLVANMFLSRQVGILTGQAQVTQAQLNEVQLLKNNLRQLALRIGQDAQKDSNLKDLLTRQQINFSNAPAAGANGAAPAPAPAPAAPAK